MASGPTNNVPDLHEVRDLIASIEADLNRLKAILEPVSANVDPSHPVNKTPDGKLSDIGIECCYRLFDEGKSRYFVANAMKISYAAATHRLAAWRKAGGEKRIKMPLE